MRAKPWEEVAVMVRAPPAAEPITALIAECSLSTVTNSLLTLPSATHLGVELHDLGLRRDRVGADHVRVDLAHRLGDGLVAGDREGGGVEHVLGVERGHRLTPSRRSS